LTWVKVDDDMPWHRKFRRTGDLRALCLALDLTGMCHCAKYGTDGFLADADLPEVIEVLPRNRRTTVLQLLVEVQRWERGTKDGRTGYWIRNYLRYNPSRTDQEAEKKRHAEATARWRARQRGDQSRDEHQSSRDSPVTEGGDNHMRTGDSAPSPGVYREPKSELSVNPPSRDPSPDPDPAAASPAGSSQAAADLAAEPQNNGQPPTKAQRAALHAALERRRQDADAEEVNEP
jgi:hypothetical protein